MYKIVDYNLSSKDDKKYIDTGKWKLIHQSTKIKDILVPNGFNLMCQGMKIIPKNN